MYYLYGIKGIVPTLILNSITLLLLSWVYARQVSLPKVELTAKETIRNGAGMLKMGLAMSWSSILVLACAYVLRWFIRTESGAEAVGLYTAGFTIINTYVGMIFTAIGTDYYPRLAAVNSDNSKMKTLANQQGEIAVLILAPLLLICMVFMPLIIQILYSNSFLEAADFVVIAAVGMMFRLGAFLIAHQFIAKGDSRLYVINETITNIYFLAFNLIGYKFLGLTGLGLAFALSYLIYFIQVFLIAKRRYSFSFSSEFLRIMIGQTALVLLCFALVMMHRRVITYVFGTIFILISGFFSLKGLNMRMDLTGVIKHKNN